MKAMKRTASMFLALVMVLSLCTVGASATNPDITAYASGSTIPVGTYTTIDAAAAAAGVNGRIVLGSGTYEFNGRQTIAVEGITLEGVADATTGEPLTTFITSASYANASKTNRKALLTIAASGVSVSNIAFDGGTYGRTLEPYYNDEGETEFSVVRVNSGTASFDNVSIEGSTRTLLTVGTSTTSATVTASNFYCIGMGKAIPSIANWNVFADVDVENGSFTLTSGAVDAFIQEGSNGTVSIAAPYHYNLTRTFFFIHYVDVTTTAKHLVDMYNYQVTVQPESYQSNITLFRTVVLENIGTGSEVERIVNDMSNHTSDFEQATISGMITLLTDVKNSTSGSDANTLAGYITTLSGLITA